MGVAVFFVVKGEQSQKNSMEPPETKNVSQNHNPIERTEPTTIDKNVDLAPKISGQTLDGKALNVADLRGKVVVVDFWASWCAPCRQYIPHLAKLYSKYKDKGLEIVGVYVDDRDPNFSNMASIKRQLNANWTQIVGQGAFESAQRYGVRGIPHIALIAKDGSLVYQNVPNRFNIEQYIKKELAK
jgi:thiol-disulfide isomerase/thioredoxin